MARAGAPGGAAVGHAGRLVVVAGVLVVVGVPGDDVDQALQMLRCQLHLDCHGRVRDGQLGVGEVMRIERGSEGMEQPLRSPLEVVGVGFQPSPHLAAPEHV